MKWPEVIADPVGDLLDANRRLRARLRLWQTVGCFSATLSLLLIILILVGWV